MKYLLLIFFVVTLADFAVSQLQPRLLSVLEPTWLPIISQSREGQNQLAEDFMEMMQDNELKILEMFTRKEPLLVV